MIGMNFGTKPMREKSGKFWWKSKILLMGMKQFLLVMWVSVSSNVKVLNGFYVQDEAKLSRLQDQWGCKRNKRDAGE